MGCGPHQWRKEKLFVFLSRSSAPAINWKMFSLIAEEQGRSWKRNHSTQLIFLMARSGPTKDEWVDGLAAQRELLGAPFTLLLLSSAAPTPILFVGCCRRSKVHSLSFLLFDWISWLLFLAGFASLVAEHWRCSAHNPQQAHQPREATNPSNSAPSSFIHKLIPLISSFCLRAGRWMAVNSLFFHHSAHSQRAEWEKKRNWMAQRSQPTHFFHSFNNWFH